MAVGGLLEVDQSGEISNVSPVCQFRISPVHVAKPVSQTSTTAIRRVACAVCCTGILLLISVGCFPRDAGVDHPAVSKLEVAIAELRASDLPVDEASLNQFHKQLASREHTEYLLQILDQVESPAFLRSAKEMPYLGEGNDVPLAGGSWSSQKEIEAFLATQQPLLEQLHNLAHEPAPVWLPIDFDNWNVHRQALREAARLLELEHRVAVQRGEDEQVVQSVQSLFGLAEVVRGDPLTAHQLLRISLHGVAIRALQLSLEQDLLDLGNEAVVGDLLKRLSLFDDHKSPYRIGHVGDRAYALADFRDPSRFGEESRFLESRCSACDALVWLDFYQRCEKVAEQHDLVTFVQASKRVHDEMRTEFADLQDFGPVRAKSALDASVALAKALARQAMHTQIGKLAVGLRVYQHRFSEWPEQLHELNQVGIDPGELVPLGGKNFGSRIEAGAAVLWGFEPTTDRFAEVPDEPPPLDDWDANVNRLWVWRLAAGGR